MVIVLIMNQVTALAQTPWMVSVNSSDSSGLVVSRLGVTAMHEKVEGPPPAAVSMLTDALTGSTGVAGRPAARA